MKSGKKSMRSFILVLAVAAIAVVSSCKKDNNDYQPMSSSSSSTSSPPADEVWMQNNVFNPHSMTVNVNTTITWRNKDATNHTVTSDSGSELNSGTVSGGGIYTHKFTAAGTYAYHCNFHGGMSGTVVVH